MLFKCLRTLGFALHTSLRGRSKRDASRGWENIALLMGFSRWVKGDWANPLGHWLRSLLLACHCSSSWYWHPWHTQLYSPTGRDLLDSSRKHTHTQNHFSVYTLRSGSEPQSCLFSLFNWRKKLLIFLNFPVPYMGAFK